MGFSSLGDRDKNEMLPKGVTFTSDSSRKISDGLGA